MSNPSTAVALRDDQTTFDDKQVAVLRSLGVEKASQADLALFFHVCRKTGLDPFARQIYMIERWTKDGVKQTIQTGIDGLRLVAQRTCAANAESLSYEDTQWCGSDGVWRDVWLSSEPPSAARVAVLRNGHRFPAVALMREYAQMTKAGTPTQMWATKGALMIAKCAEALALRKAFPMDLAGLYIDDEMHAASNAGREPRATAPQVSLATLTQPAGPPQEAPEADGEPVDAEVVDIVDAMQGDQEPEYRTEAQSKALHATLRDAGVTDRAAGLALISEAIGRDVDSTKTLTRVEASAAIEYVKAVAGREAQA